MGAGFTSGVLMLKLQRTLVMTVVKIAQGVYLYEANIVITMAIIMRITKKLYRPLYCYKANIVITKVLCTSLLGNFIFPGAI
jgi:hypothetical protein